MELRERGDVTTSESISLSKMTGAGAACKIGTASNASIRRSFMA